MRPRIVVTCLAALWLCAAHARAGDAPASGWTWDAIVAAWTRPDAAPPPASETAALRAFLAQAREESPVGGWRLACVARLVVRRRPDLAFEAIEALAAAFGRSVRDERVAVTLGATRPQMRALGALDALLRLVPPKPDPRAAPAVAALGRARLRGPARVLALRTGVDGPAPVESPWALDVLFESPRLEEALGAFTSSSRPSGWEWVLAWPEFAARADLSTLGGPRERYLPVVLLGATGPAGARRALSQVDPKSADERRSIREILQDTPFAFLQATGVLPQERAPDPATLGVLSSWDGTERCEAWTRGVAKLEAAMKAHDRDALDVPAYGLAKVPSEVVYRTSPVLAYLRGCADGTLRVRPETRAAAVAAIQAHGLEVPRGWTFDADGRVASEQMIAMRVWQSWRVATLETVEPLVDDARPSSLTGPGQRPVPLGEAALGEHFGALGSVVRHPVADAEACHALIREMRADRPRWLLREE